MIENLLRSKRVIVGVCCLLCILMVWWFCYNFQHSIVKEARKNGIDTTKRTITRVAVPADIDAAVNHAVWARGVAEGQLLPSHITVYEHRDRIALYTPIPRLITGTIFMFTKNLDSAYDYAVIIGPIAAVLMVFILIYRITGSVLFATSFSLSIIVMARLPDQIAKDVSSLLSGKNFGFIYSKGYLFNNERMDEIFISRLEAPALTYFFYALAFYFIFTRHLAKKGKSWIVIGIAAGMLSLINLFHFLYASIFCCLLLLSHIIFEDKKNGLKSVLHFGAGYVIAILPFVLLLLYGMASPWYHDIESRVHLEIGRQWRSSLNLEYVWSLMVSIISLLMYWRLHIKQREVFIWTACLFLVRPIFFNLQIILGSIPEPDHIERYGTNFGEWLGLVFILYGITYWLKNNQYPLKNLFQHFRWVLYAIPLVMIFSSMLWIYHAPAERAKRVWANFVRPEGEDELMQWIKKYTPKHSVFLTTDFEAGLRVVAVTGRHLFISPSNTTLMNREIEQRLIKGFAILGVKSEGMKKYLIDDSHQYAIIFANRYFPRYIDSSFLARASDRIVPEEKIRELENLYEAMTFEKNKKKSFLNGLRLDYLLVSPTEKGFLNVDIIKERFGRPIYEKEGYLVFKYL
jgi:hypothetical protein